MGIFQKRKTIEKANISLIYKNNEKQLRKELSKSINSIINSNVSYLILNISFESKKNYVTKYKLSEFLNRAKTTINYLSINYFFIENKQNYKVVNSHLAEDESGLHFALLFIIGDLAYLDNNIHISLNNVIDFYLHDKNLVPLVTHSFSQISVSYMKTLNTLFDFEECRFDFNRNNLIWSLITTIENKDLEGNIMKIKIQKYFKTINQIVLKELYDIKKEFIVIPEICFSVSFSEMFNCVNNESSNLNLLLRNINSLTNLKRIILSFRIKNDDVNLVRILFMFSQYLCNCDSLVLTCFFDHETVFTSFNKQLARSNTFAMKLNYKRLKIISSYGDKVKLLEYGSNVLMTILMLTYNSEYERMRSLRKRKILVNIAKCLLVI